jgi:hypothetical protein
MGTALGSRASQVTWGSHQGFIHRQPWGDFSTSIRHSLRIFDYPKRADLDSLLPVWGINMGFAGQLGMCMNTMYVIIPGMELPNGALKAAKLGVRGYCGVEL